MIHHERLKPPPMTSRPTNGTPSKKGFIPSSWPNRKTMLALRNGYLGMRGCLEECGPNRFYETRLILAVGEAAARVPQRRKRPSSAL